jgi:hypothetical protein
MPKWSSYDVWNWSQSAKGRYDAGYVGFYRDNARSTGASYPKFSDNWWLERGKVDAQAGVRTVHGLWLRYDKGGTIYFVGDGQPARVGSPPGLSAQEQADLALKPAPAPSTSHSGYLWGYIYAFISEAYPTFQSYAADSYEFWREQGLRDAFAFRPKRVAQDISFRADDGVTYYVGHGEDPTRDQSAYKWRLSTVGQATTGSTVTDVATTGATTTTTTGTTTPAGSWSFQLGVPLGGFLQQIFGQQPGYGGYPQYAGYMPSGGYVPQMQQPFAQYGGMPQYAGFPQQGYAPYGGMPQYAGFPHGAVAQAPFGQQPQGPFLQLGYTRAV